jgi:hypothetical protein
MLPGWRSGKSLSWRGSGRLQHPPRYAAYLTPSSPIFPHSSFDVEGQLSVAIELMNSPTGRPNNLGHVGSGHQHGENVVQPAVEPVRRQY